MDTIHIWAPLLILVNVWLILKTLPACQCKTVGWDERLPSILVTAFLGLNAVALAGLMVLMSAKL